jgi:hypothetical protein
MAKTTSVTATFPAAVTAFGTVTSWDITSDANHITGKDAAGEVDAEAYNEKKWELEISGETESFAALKASDTFTFDGSVWTVDKATYGETNDGVGEYSVTAHRFLNL